MSPDEHPRPPPAHLFTPPHTRIEPPPLPPKTPLPDSNSRQRQPQLSSSRLSNTHIPPYPMDDDRPPPPVNMARKPEYRAH
jgi:hypothetical protein